MAHFFRPTLFLLSSLFCLALGTNLAVAQSANPVRPASFSFSADIEKVKSSFLGPMMADWEKESVRSGPQAIVAAAQSISGSLSFPGSVQDLMTMGPQEPIPFDFMVQVDFADAAKMSTVWSEIEENFEAVEVDGMKGFRLEGETPNMMFTKLDDDSMAIGTSGYLKKGVKDLNSKPVADLLNSLPKHAVRVALDMGAAADLMDEFNEMMQGQIPPEAAPFIEVAMKIDAVKLSLDMEDEKMMVLGIRGKDEEATKEIFGTIDGLLNMAKFAAGAQIAQMKEDSPKTAEVVSTLIASLKPKNEGNEMTMVVPRPAGMNEMLKEVIEQTQKAANEVQDMNRMRQAALAAYNYESTYREMPFLSDKDETSAQLSWRVRLLPYLEEAPIYDQLKRSEGWESSANRDFTDKMPAVFGKDSTSMSDIAFIQPEVPVQRLAGITDGMSSTFMLLQYKAGQPWLSPKNLSVDEAVKLYMNLAEGETLLAARYDGSVQKLAKGDMTEEEFRSALIPNDGK
ncbi:MAG: DUF1559 domain-containing protein [Planctomycetota bacterium]